MQRLQRARFAAHTSTTDPCIARRTHPPTCRFAGLAATAGAYSGSDTSLYYSLDDGLVHFVFVDTELWATGSSDDQAALLSWLEDDLKAVDRRVTPWVVAVGHRAAWMKHGGGSDLAPLLHDYGVNLLLAGHEHNYQRTYGVSTGHVGAAARWYWLLRTPAVPSR